MDDQDDLDRSTRLTNDDFRRLLMTPRHPTSSSGGGGAPSGSSSSATAGSSSMGSTARTSQSNSVREMLNRSNEGDGEDDKAERRRKKKSFYAKLKKQEDDKMAELALKYRDRARERRDGANPDYQADDPLSTAGGYRAVAPDVKSGMDAAERRRQQIQESKFLGGDMEHTHLVKGLDYALLQKVRSEIQTKEQEEEEELESLVTDKKEPKKKKKQEEEEEIEFRTKTGRNIYRAALPNPQIIRNELFAPGRMAYVIELEDELAESDIPCTLIRSRADCPGLETQATLSTNDIVINKLAQILSYLRQGSRHSKKNKKKDKAAAMAALSAELPKRSVQDESIYGDIGDYVATTQKSKADSREKKQGPYFAKPALDEEGEADRNMTFRGSWSEAVSGSRGGEDSRPDRDDSEKSSKRKIPETRSQQLLSRLAAEPEGYAECYPGMEEMHDAVDDSDDEVDYTKMDLGNKKGPIGRWDFDTQEEYSDYMNSKEALPKAAFQYGVKMADGRRTRKYHKEKNEKAELDREWQKIQNIIQKRKGPGESSSRAEGSPEFKKPRY